MENELTRREFLRIAAIAAAATATGCVAPATPVPPAPTTAPVVAPTSAPATVVPTVPAVLSAPKGSLTWGRAFKAVSADPHKNYTLQDMVLCRHVYEPLVELNSQGQLVPGLAEGWNPSSDGRTWTFKLRQGVKFNDGTPFTAEAVKKAIERVKGNAKSGYAFIFDPCEDTPTNIVNDYTIEVKTKAANGVLPYNLVSFYIPSPDAASNTDLTWDKRVGTGPFKLTSFEIDKAYVFEANTNYWRKGYPKLQSITWRPMVEQSTLTAAAKSGEVDLVDGLSPANFLSLKGNSNWESLSLPSWRLDFYTINQLGNIAALKNAKVRQAMAYAIDRDLINKEMMQGFADSWASYPPKGILGTSTKIAANPFDLKKAQELMKASGFASGFEFTLQCPTGVSTHGLEKDVAQFVVQEWNELGIKAKIEVNDQTTAGANYRAGKYDVGFVSSVALTGDPDRYLRERLITDVYKTGYNNPTVRKMIDDAVAVTETQKRQQIYEDLQQLVWEDMPIIYTGQCRILVAKKSNVTGFVGMPNQLFNMTEVGLT